MVDRKPETPEQAKDLAFRATQDENVQRCMVYVLLSQQGMKKYEIAQELGFTREWLRLKIHEWERDGLIEEVRRILIGPAIEDILSAHEFVLKEWPGLIREMVRIARGDTNAKDRTRWEITAWLGETVVTPSMDTKAMAGSIEASYADNHDEMYDPVNITPGVDLLIPKDQNSEA